MRCTLITGANRGLGLELTRQCLARGDRVFAGCRQPVQANALRQLAANHPDKLTLLALDVTNNQSIATAIATVQSRVDCLDLLVNNAGVFPRNETVSTLDAGIMLHTFHVNAVGPMIMAQACLSLLQKSDRSVILNISSQLGSLTREQKGKHYSYHSSKAALNMLTRILAVELRELGIVVVCVHPGWVQTDMGGRKAPLSPEESVQGLLGLTDRLTLADSGFFYTWQGQRHPW